MYIKCGEWSKKEREEEKEKNVLLLLFFFIMYLNLNDHQINIDCYLHRMLQMNLVVTTNPKPMIVSQKIKKKEIQT